jgi:glycine oxidase
VAQTPDVVIVGGGIIGLSIAWYLAREGVTVRVLERDRLGSHASSAAAGMLAPLAESDEITPLFSLGKASLDLYPTFLEQLAFDSELDVLLEGPGLLRLAFNGKEADQLRALVQTPAGQELGAKWLDEMEVREIQPGLPEAVCGAVYSPREQDVDPKRLVQALVKACQKQGVSFVEGIHAEQQALVPSTESKTVYAAGAWTGELLASLDYQLPVRPVKGQVVLLQQPAKDLRYTLYGFGGYLVPRENGNVLVGATSENAGFDERVTDEGIEQLLTKATHLYSAADQFTFIEAWASVRPGTADDLPILGRLTGVENAYIATGHYRNGILQAPLTAKLMAELIITDKDPEGLAPFSAARFQQAGVA